MGGSSMMIVTRSDAGIKLICHVQEFEKFDNDRAYLRFDLSGVQKWYHDRGEYEKANSFENAEDLIDTDGAAVSLPEAGTKLLAVTSHYGIGTLPGTRT
jgi:hypothetical protein